MSLLAWENPIIKDHDTGFGGDNDPIDVCEIGSVTRKTGDVIQVKVRFPLALSLASLHSYL